MLALAQCGEVDEALAIADRLAAGPKVDAELRMDLARCHAIASRTLAGQDPQRMESLQAKAVQSLRAAVQDGYHDRGYLQGEPDFAALRDRADFKALLDGLPR
jgi:hypothetical protein